MHERMPSGNSESIHSCPEHVAILHQVSYKNEHEMQTDAFTEKELVQSFNLHTHISCPIHQGFGLLFVVSGKQICITCIFAYNCLKHTVTFSFII